MAVNKKIIIDENNNAVEVVIPIDEWEEIESLIQEKQFKEKKSLKKLIWIRSLELLNFMKIHWNFKKGFVRNGTVRSKSNSAGHEYCFISHCRKNTSSGITQSFMR